MREIKPAPQTKRSATRVAPLFHATLPVEAPRGLRNSAARRGSTLGIGSRRRTNTTAGPSPAAHDFRATSHHDKRAVLEPQ